MFFINKIIFMDEKNINPIIWEKFTQRICQIKDLLSKNPKILVAVSAGPDSIFLSYLLHRYCLIHNIKLLLCYVNHKLRTKKEIKLDISLIKNFSSKINTPFVTTEIKNVHKYDEETLREARYQCLFNVAKKFGCSIIALGHNQDDLVETFLFNLFRGTGVRGLIGIPVIREFYVNKKIFYLFRPLIDIPKKNILESLKQLNIKFATDSTNLKNCYSRNFIRNKILPKIKSLFSNIDSNIINTSSILNEFYEYLKPKIDSAFNNTVVVYNKKAHLDFKKFLMYNRLFQKEILLKTIETLFKKNKKKFRSSYTKIISSVLHFFNTKNTILKINKNMIIKKLDKKIIFSVKN